MTGQKTTATRTFQVELPPNQAIERIEQLVIDAGGRSSATSEGLSAKFGSQIVMRFLGGWFVSNSKLPIRADVRVTASADGSSDVVVDVRDSMGIGSKWRMEEKYQSAVNDVADALSTIAP